MQPDPRQQPVSSIYNFQTWSRQLRDFTREVIGGGPVTLTCNSVGGIAGLQVRLGRASAGVGGRGRAWQQMRSSMRHGQLGLPGCGAQTEHGSLSGRLQAGG